MKTEGDKLYTHLLLGKSDMGMPVAIPFIVCGERLIQSSKKEKI
jgi:hypothetical protein